MVKLKFQQTKPILHNKEVLDCLNEKFVAVLVDKGYNNVSIICEKFDMHKIVLEVDICSDHSSIYHLSQKHSSDVIFNNNILRTSRIRHKGRA